jgi:glycosyltransferase involved in cell wall biosynthesis
VPRGHNKTNILGVNEGEVAVALSIVIPTLNEALHLPAAIASARTEARGTRPPEIIVADCGSTDGTDAVAEKAGVHLVRPTPPLESRAAACNAGAADAVGDVLLFLDADSLLPRGYDLAITRTLADLEVVAGAFEFALAGRQWQLRIVEIINRVRYRIWPWYYSDQGLFVRTAAFRRVGGFPRRRIMETSDLCKVLWRHGRLTLVHRPLPTSPRRFLAGGVWRVLAHDVLIWARDLLGQPTEQFGAAYHDDNRHRGLSAS